VGLATGDSDSPSPRRRQGVAAPAVGWCGLENLGEAERNKLINSDEGEHDHNSAQDRAERGMRTGHKIIETPAFMNKECVTAKATPPYVVVMDIQAEEKSQKCR